ncbi:MAG: hypothetical protein ACI8ZN_000576 [Bacteroidia bacterium]|jgi:hypothetical protein
MNTKIISMAVAALFFAGCSNQSSTEHDHDADGNHMNSQSIHEHNDGIEHQDHNETKHSQEEFKVSSDRDSMQNEEHGHDHQDGKHTH